MEATETTSLVSDAPNGTVVPEVDQNVPPPHPSPAVPTIGRPRFAALLVCIWMTWFIASFDSTLMASSHPVISTYFSASKAATWFSTVFLLASCTASPVFARLSDTFGRRAPLVASLSIFTVGTVWCAVAPTVVHVIVARAVCGLGAGASLSQTMTLISDLVPLRQRGTFISWVNLAYGCGSSLGAAMGGYPAEAASWRWEFGVQVPFLLIMVGIVAASVPANLGPALARNATGPSVSLWTTLSSFDLSGSALLALSIACLILCLDLGGNIVPWTHPIVAVFATLFLVSSLALLRVQKHQKQPVVPLSMLTHNPGGAIVFSNFLNCMSVNTVFFNSPLFFQAVLLDSPTVSGERLMSPLIGMIAAFSTGHIIAWRGQLRLLVVGGFILILAGLALQTWADGHLPGAAYTAMISLPLIGQGFAFPTLIVAQLAVHTQEDVAIATATLLLFKNLGNILGVAVSGLVTQNALVFYLERLVQGPDKEDVIEKVRSAVESIHGLAEPYQGQVIESYLRTMHLTFFQGAVTAAIALALALWMKLPTLGHGKNCRV